VEYKKSIAMGTNNRKKANLTITAFNTRKRSPIFSGVEVEPIWITRLGVKACLSEKYSGHSGGSVSFIAESISSHDESGRTLSHAQQRSLDGQFFNGLQTTLSGKGTDKLLFIRGDIIRDASFRKGVSLIGSRQIIAFDQGIRVASYFPLLYRQKASFTHFVPLSYLPAKNDAPITCVLYGKFGCCVGEIVFYDFFILGGPFSC
jgi:hypothetical protein